MVLKDYYFQEKYKENDKKIYQKNKKKFIKIYQK